MVYNPLAGGLFSGKYTTLPQQQGSNKINLAAMPTSEGRFEDTAQGKMYRDRYFKPAVFEALSIIEPVAKHHNLTLIETALRWCVHHSQLSLAGNKDKKGGLGNDGIILGISSYDQLVSNIEDCEKGPLPDDVVKALDMGWEKARGEAVTYWR